MKTIKTCPKCGSSQLIGWGYSWRHGKKSHKFRCNDCGYCYIFFDE